MGIHYYGIGPQNHNGDGLLGPTSVIGMYMDPLGNRTPQYIPCCYLDPLGTLQALKNLKTLKPKNP